MKGRVRAAFYDLVSRGLEKKHGRALREPVLAGARGRVLEIGAGTGANVAHYPEAIAELVLTDPSPGMVARSRRRAEVARRAARAVQAPAERLPFDDGSFDTVVATFVLCSVDDQAAALREIGRVLRPDGMFLFLEHVRSDDPKLARWQDRLEGIWKAVADGCHPNLDTLASIEREGFTVERLERSELPAGPALVRPCVSGSARPPGSRGREGA
jgi:ubiquinone/menaquinone biosynthesis C-methylase UbiE